MPRRKEKTLEVLLLLVAAAGPVSPKVRSPRRNKKYRDEPAAVSSAAAANLA